MNTLWKGANRRNIPLNTVQRIVKNEHESNYIHILTFTVAQYVKQALIKLLIGMMKWKESYAPTW